MEAYKRGGHTVWDCKNHVVWVTKYRYPVLGGDVGVRCRELLRETARAHEMVVHAGSINVDPSEPVVRVELDQRRDHVVEGRLMGLRIRGATPVCHRSPRR
jgi:hypothetical protein